jgi:RHS repeat-associated protein
LTYRFGYTGMESDAEVKGGSHYTTLFRQYDPRLGRWWSTDPITHEWESPYAGMGGNPISLVDPLGLDEESSPLNPAPPPRPGGTPIMLAEVADYNNWQRQVAQEIVNEHVQWGGYRIQAHYEVADGKGRLIYYSAVREGAQTPDYYIEPSGFDLFIDNVAFYRAGADAAYGLYGRGELPEFQLQRITALMVRDATLLMSSVGTEWATAVRDPNYYVYLLGAAGMSLRRPVVVVADRGTLVEGAGRSIRATDLQLEKKWKHAKILGVRGNFRKTRAGEFRAALQKAVNAPNVRVIRGLFRGREVIHYFDPRTGIVIITDPSNDFITTMRLSQAQRGLLITTGKLGGE